MIWLICHNSMPLDVNYEFGLLCVPRPPINNTKFLIHMYLRNKFHFSEVHGSMNAMGHVQSKWHPKCVTLTLHGTPCVLTSMNLRKMKFISYIYTSFLHRFC